MIRKRYRSNNTALLLTTLLLPLPCFSVYPQGGPFHESALEMSERHHNQIMAQNNRNFWTNTAIKVISCLLITGNMIITLHSNRMRYDFYNQIINQQRELQQQYIHMQLLVLQQNRIEKTRFAANLDNAQTMNLQPLNKDQLESIVSALLDPFNVISGIQSMVTSAKAQATLNSLCGLFNRIKGT